MEKKDPSIDSSSDSYETEDSEDEKEIAIVITAENIKIMEETIKRHKALEDRKWNKVQYSEFFRQNRKDEAFKSIEDSKQRSLIQCYHVLTRMIRAYEFREYHLEYLKMLKEMVKTYSIPIVLYLNTPDGIDALITGYKIDKKLILEILELCVSKIRGQFLEKSLVKNLVFLQEKYIEIKETSDKLKMKEIQKEINNYNGYEIQEEKFAFHYFKYENLKRIVDTKEGLEAEDLIDLEGLEERFKKARYSTERKNIILKKREEYLNTVKSDCQKIEED